MTLAVKEAIRSKIAKGQEDLSNGQNEREYDLFVKGMIQGFREVLEVDLETTQETPENEV